ncbi:TetR/AcrR family transcriptional regulator [Streptomyces sp. N2-109]|uniref:TetR/AcrR family transcriptional regulator n=1 Tax=Streptomyces gossypii TaxID=2883101 RepID=A0ABT2K3Y7_9ACTN|nr:TetR/AcrR family transcriptional regulator [Streptomyces gossypii]MCT2594189.1 TetR/AcrR family transcriptional regulator [Streptomyces gossypii]
MSTGEKLIVATQELLWERGYVGTSPKAIQQRAGAGQGSMYHHFAGKAGLAAAAVRRSAEQLRATAEGDLRSSGSALERVRAYLTRERSVLRGCRIGGLAQDPDIVADPELRRPLEETFGWLRDQLTEVLEKGRRSGELTAELDARATAATIVAVVQGGYVLARSAADAAPFHQAVDGLLRLLEGARAQTSPPGLRPGTETLVKSLPGRLGR